MSEQLTLVQRGEVIVDGLGYMAYELLPLAGKMVCTIPVEDRQGEMRVLDEAGNMICTALCPELTGPHELPSPHRHDPSRLLNVCRAMLRRAIPAPGGMSMANMSHDGEFGFRVNWARRKLRMTVEELAAAIGVEPAAIVKYESGKAPRAHAVNKLAFVLQTTSLNLLYGMSPLEVLLSDSEAMLLDLYGELPAGDKESWRKQLDAACHKILSNPVIEDYHLEIE